MPTCRQCTQEFEVSQFEIDFLKRIAPSFGGQQFELPLPTACPDCRLRGRTIYRNEGYLYKNTSAASGAEIISLYSPQAEWSRHLKLYTPEEWWADTWDPMDYGQPFDFNRPFFEQFAELSAAVPRLALVQSNNVNSPYTTGTGMCKNCYLINCSENTEDSYYGKLVQNSRDIVDSDFVYDSELCYDCFNITNCYGCVSLSFSANCHDCFLSENLQGCKNCLLCTNLVNQEYCVLNKPVSPEEFAQQKAKCLASRQSIAAAHSTLAQLRRERVHKYAAISHCTDSTGDFLSDCKNCHDCYDVNDSEDCRYLIVGVNVKDIVDCSNMYVKPEFCYQVMGTIGIYHVLFSLYIFHSQDILYSESIWNSSNLFGCVGLRKKEYCILNTQYTPEEYAELMPKIITHMRKTGEWGQFFPATNSPFPYNNTVAHDYLPLTKDQALAAGYRWLETDVRDYQPQTYQLPDTIAETPDSITQELLSCTQCHKNYRIIKQELAHLRQLHLPAPNQCPNCRQQTRMARRNPRHLYSRSCSQCSQTIQTTFAPDRPEKVYCEECYQKEIY